MKVKPIVPLISSILICVLGIGITSITGVFKTESAKTPAKFNQLENFEGQYRADDIKGSYTFSEISNLYNIPLEYLKKAFHVNEDVENFQCKDLKTLFSNSEYEIGTSSVRLFVAYFLGQPLELTEATYITSEGKDIIETYGNPTDEQKQYLSDNVVQSKIINEENKVEIDESKNEELKKDDEESNNEKTVDKEYVTIDIKGSHYIKDLVNEYKIPIEDFRDAFLLNDSEVNSFQVKDIKNKLSAENLDIGTNSIKIFIAFYNGLLYDVDDSNAMFTSKGAEIVKSKGKPLDEQLLYMEGHIVN